MQHMAERFRPHTVCFHLVSDEPIDPAAFGGLNIEVHRGAPLEDMYLLASCDYIIGPNSTFSHWASFGELFRSMFSTGRQWTGSVRAIQCTIQTPTTIFECSSLPTSVSIARGVYRCENCFRGRSRDRVAG